MSDLGAPGFSRNAGSRFPSFCWGHDPDSKGRIGSCPRKTSLLARISHRGSKRNGAEARGCEAGDRGHRSRSLALRRGGRRSITKQARAYPPVQPISGEKCGLSEPPAGGEQGAERTLRGGRSSPLRTVAEAQENRTLRRGDQPPPVGFEDRARHQPRSASAKEYSTRTPMAGRAYTSPFSRIQSSLKMVLR